MHFVKHMIELWSLAFFLNTLFLIFALNEEQIDRCIHQQSFSLRRKYIVMYLFLSYS